MVSFHVVAVATPELLAGALALTAARHPPLPPDLSALHGPLCSPAIDISNAPSLGPTPLRVRHDISLPRVARRRGCAVAFVASWIASPLDRARSVPRARVDWLLGIPT